MSHTNLFVSMWGCKANGAGVLNVSGGSVGRRGRGS